MRNLPELSRLALARIVRQALQRVDKRLFHAALGTLDVVAGESQGIVALDLGGGRWCQAFVLT
jgi:hypothetical protein